MNSWSDTAGHFLQCEFSFDGQLFRVCCVYAPNRNPDRDQFLEDVPDRIDPSVPTLVVGDFNTRVKDRHGSDPLDSSPESSACLVSFFDACCIVDIWRYLYPDSSGFTWTRWDGSIASRIDLCGVPYVWMSSVSSCGVVPWPFSDHCALLLSMSVPDVVPPGPGLWKLNISILSEEEYYELISAA